SGQSALMYASDDGHAEVLWMLLDHDDVDINFVNGKGMTTLSYAIRNDDLETVRLLSERNDIIIEKDVEYSIHHKKFAALATILESQATYISTNDVSVEFKWFGKYLKHESAMNMLGVDLPVEVQDGNLVQRQDYSYSWASFMDATHPVDVNVRLSCLESILKDEKFASCSHDLLRELAFGKDKHGRQVIQVTDAATRKYLNERLFYCGRYEIFEGPPVHMSNTAVVVMAYDHGICTQLFQQHKNNHGNLDVNGFIKCNKVLGRVKGNQKREKEKWRAEFQLWDKSYNGSLSEGEYLNYCRHHFGGKLKVSLKFMRKSNEYDREIKTREQLQSDVVLHQLLSVEQSLFQAHLRTLKINRDFSMANFRHVLVLPAAECSLEDIFLKERPDCNKTKSLLTEVLLGIEVLHKQDLVHGDLKKLNVLRVQNQLKLIDFDAAVRIYEPLGAKVSSGILPPEMFHNLETADDVEKYNTYWGRESHEISKLKRTQVNSTYVVKAYRDGCDVSTLPYSLIKASTAVDMWSFGCMMFQMLSGEELVPTDINQNVRLDRMHKAATWTDEKLRQRIDEFIVGEDANDLVKRLLVVDPTERWSATAVLRHPYFTGIQDTSALTNAMEELIQNQAKVLSSLSELHEGDNMHHKTQKNSIEEVKTAFFDLQNEMVSRLSGRSVVINFDKLGKSTLMYASEKGQAIVVRMLLDHGGVDINVVDNWGKSALMYASKNGHAIVVRMLLDHGGVDINVVDKRGSCERSVGVNFDRRNG
ncbi:hypothetical protein As57867_004210, partial [Aphanomyces stellatus]